LFVFDYVGRNPDEEAGRRRAASVAITTLGLAAIAGVVIGVSAWTAAKVVQVVIADAELVEVLIEKEEFAPPPPPPPPPPAASEAQDEDADDPDEMTEEIKDLTDEVKDEVKSDTQKEAAGDPDGQVGGVAGGVAGGVVGGVLDGRLGSARVLHHSELEFKKQVMPNYPKEAEALNLGTQRCVVKVWIDETGTPFEVRVDACPEVFHAETRQAVMGWRWYPPKAGKEKTSAQTTIGVTFKMQ
jgi:protein TonB